MRFKQTVRSVMELFIFVTVLSSTYLCSVCEFEIEVVFQWDVIFDKID